MDENRFSARRRFPLLREIRGAHATLKLAHHLFKGDVAGLEHHQQMVEDIGGLGDQGRVVLGDGRYGSLHRLLAKLLGRLDRGAVEQPPRMGVLWPCGPPGLDIGGEAPEDVVLTHILAHTLPGAGVE